MVLWAVAVLGCGTDAPAHEPRTIERLRERSVEVTCASVEGFAMNHAVVEDLHAVSDTTFLALFPLDRVVTLFDDRLEPVFSLSFEENGPRGVESPRAATVVDDTLVYFADLGSRSVRILSRSGEDRGTIRTGFAPDGIRAGPSGVVLTAFPMALGVRDDLVYELDADGPRPLGLRMDPYDDPRVAALGNLLEVTVLPDGTVVAAHQTLSSRAALFRRRPQGGFDVHVTTVPVSASEGERLGEVPTDLFERENIGDLAAPVIAASVDRNSGEYLYLTRTGRAFPAGGTEKAIVRARPDLSYVESYRLDVNAQDFVYLADAEAVLVVDQEAAWHRCALR
ncbi:MAG: hypothetical protein R3326_03745 [Gemmatimonadota bacterium]|nr:hypothetical protein [Gemmatimonadota bacterium]